MTEQTDADHDSGRLNNEPAASVSNPFAERNAAEEEMPRINLTKRRAALLGTAFGLLMVVLLLACFLLAAALSALIN